MDEYIPVLDLAGPSCMLLCLCVSTGVLVVLLHFVTCVRVASDSPADW